jgi:uncharacterized membrane protein HdeD (DUF308 family)
MTAVQQDSLFSSPSTGERWLLVIWGILLFVSGLFFIARPAVTAVVWIEILAIGWLIAGIFDAVNSVMTRGHWWGWKLAGAIISILAALYIIFNPLLGSAFVVEIAFIFLAVAAIVRGLLMVFVGLKVPGGSKWALIVMGVLLTIIGVWLLLNPLVGMLTLMLLFGVLLIVGSVIVVFLAITGR